MKKYPKSYKKFSGFFLIQNHDAPKKWKTKATSSWNTKATGKFCKFIITYSLILSSGAQRFSVRSGL